MCRQLGCLGLAGLVALSACHYDPYPWPRAGEPSATVLESQLNERDSLQDAATDVIAVAEAVRNAVQGAYPATHWSAISEGGQFGCPPPFTFLTGSVYKLPEYDSPPPSSEADRAAVVSAAADVLRAHHAEKVDVVPGKSASGQLPREHGNVEFTISVPVAPYQPVMSVAGGTGCHHAAPGPGPWNTSATPTPPR